MGKFGDHRERGEGEWGSRSGCSAAPAGPRVYKGEGRWRLARLVRGVCKRVFFSFGP
jgi:hypothetical protein